MAAVGAGSDRSTSGGSVALLAIVAVAFGLRLHGLDARTLTHAEVYVPRLEMPAYVTAPPPRPTLAATVSGTLHHDNHPPGYYGFMWLWTGAFGTGLQALRWPSALAGAATVGLLGLLVRRRDGTAVALATAALLALHGHHVFWSQQARMWVFLGLFAVLSLLLLEALHRRYRARTAIAYVAVLSAGLWFEYSFWPFFAAQLLFEVLRTSDAPKPPVTLELQLAAFASASPVLVFLGVHLSLERTAYLARTGLVDHLSGFLLLQWWLRGPEPPGKYGAVASLLVVALFVAVTGLLVAGVLRARADVPGRGSEVPPARMAWSAKAWGPLARGCRKLRTNERLRRLSADPATLHALVPVAILLAGSLAVPSVAPRSLLFATPFTLWLVVRGLFALTPWPWLRAASVAVLLAVGCWSVREYKTPWRGDHDYQALAAALQPRLEADDVILINRDWRSQPMHYYLPPSRHHTGDFEANGPVWRTAERAAPTRVWVLIFGDDDIRAFEALAPRLRGYRESGRVEAPGGYALLLRRGAARGPDRE